MYKINKRLYLYVLLVICVSVQVVLVKRIIWFPDIILLMVVFTGIFRGGAEGLGLGLVAGFLRGLFSVETIPLDILLFPAVGLVSSMLTRMLNRQNPVTQIFTTAFAVFTVVVAHTLYLNMISGNDIGIPFVFLASWKHLLATIFVSPFVFAFLKGLLRLEE